MSRTARALAATAVAAALVLTGQAAQSAASARPVSAGSEPDSAVKTKPVKSAKGDANLQLALARDIARRGSALDRAVAPARIGVLSAESQSVLLANVALDKADLAVLADTTAADPRAARKDLRSYRVTNFVIVVNLLRQAEALAPAAAELSLTDPTAGALAVELLSNTVSAAWGITATSPHADLVAARTLLHDARATLESAGVVGD